MDSDSRLFARFGSATNALHAGFKSLQLLLNRASGFLFKLRLGSLELDNVITTARMGKHGDTHPSASLTWSSWDMLRTLLAVRASPCLGGAALRPLFVSLVVLLNYASDTIS